MHRSARYHKETQSSTCGVDTPAWHDHVEIRLQIPLRGLEIKTLQVHLIVLLQTAQLVDRVDGRSQTLNIVDGCFEILFHHFSPQSCQLPATPPMMSAM